MSVTLADLATIVSTARFDMLVGEMESQFLDAKGQPYRFDEGTDGKRAFAKDVASFANAQGGYILIGFATKISDVNAGEQIAEVRPIRSQYFNTEQHRKILQEWLYPQPLGIEIDRRHHRESGNVATGVSKARNKSGSDRVENKGHDDWDCRSQLFGDLRAYSAVLNNHLHAFLN